MLTERRDNCMYFCCHSPFRRTEVNRDGKSFESRGRVKLAGYQIRKAVVKSVFSRFGTSSVWIVVKLR